MKVCRSCGPWKLDFIPRAGGVPRARSDLRLEKTTVFAGWSSDDQRPRFTERDHGWEAISVIQMEALGGLPCRQRECIDSRELRERDVIVALMLVGRRGNWSLYPA